MYILGVPENGVSPHSLRGENCLRHRAGGGATWAPPGVRMPGAIRGSGSSCDSQVPSIP